MRDYVMWSRKIHRRIRARQLTWAPDVDTNLGYEDYFLELFRRTTGGAKFAYTQPSPTKIDDDPPNDHYWQLSMGPIVWKWLHTTSINVPLHEAVQFYWFIQGLIECPVCRGHYTQMLLHFRRTDSIAFQDAFVMGAFIHNVVNYRLGKKLELGISELRKVYKLD